MKKLVLIGKLKFAVASVLTVSLCMIIIASCTKSSSTATNPFLGTWTGSTTCTGAAYPTSGTTTLTGTSNTVNVTGNCGSGTCYKTFSFPASVNGNAYSLSTTSFQDNCSGSYTVSASGAISGNTLTMIVSSTTPTGSGTCTFTGTK